MKGQGAPSAEPPIQCKTGEGHRPEHVAYFVRSEKSSQRDIRHLRVAKNIDAIIHRELVPQRVAVNQRHHGQQQSDAQVLFHFAFVTRRHGRRERESALNQNSAKKEAVAAGQSAPVPNPPFTAWEKTIFATSFEIRGPVSNIRYFLAVAGKSGR